MTLTDVRWVRPPTMRKVDGMATVAMSRGTTAMKLAKTKASTARAPIASERGLGQGTPPLLEPPVSQLGEAGDARVPCGRGGGGRGGGDRGSDAVPNPVLLRGVDQAEAGPAISGGEVGVAGVLLVDKPRPGDGRGGRSEHAVSRGR